MQGQEMHQMSIKPFNQTLAVSSGWQFAAAALQGRMTPGQRMSRIGNKEGGEKSEAMLLSLTGNGV